MPDTGPMRRASAAGVAMRHPTPDLHALQGAYVRNVQRLENSAAALSESGSDMGDEIRRLNRLSRESSLHSVHASRRSVDRASLRNSRTEAQMANANVATKRWSGSGVGPGVSSPRESLGGWTHTSPLQEESSWENVQMTGSEEYTGEPDWPLRSPVVGDPALDAVPQHPHDTEQQSSAAQLYDAIASEQAHLEDRASPSPVHNTAALDVLEGNDRQDRRRSDDTFREAALAFQDFDGVHFNPETEELIEVDEYGNEVRRVSARNSSGVLSAEAATMLRMPRSHPAARGVPPPAQGMVYYPAPVPKMLNLPKRLSQLPSAHVQAARRSQALGELPAESRQSAPWLPLSSPTEELGGNARHRRSGSSSVLPPSFLNERMSANMSNLPPQLRASAFFERPSIHHDVEIQSESAVATLDSILAASATAPVTSFTDHPFAGDVFKSVYAAEAPSRRSMMSLASSKEKKAKRRSSLSNLLKRRNTDDGASTLARQNSRSTILTDIDPSEGKNRLRKRRSQMSLGDELDRHSEALEEADEDQQTPEPRLSMGLVAEAQNATSPVEGQPHRPMTSMSGHELNQGEETEQDLREQEEQEALEEDSEAMFVQPSTLLAELQVRKAQLKSRSRTAATAFPNGMHSTLLELDAVEEIAKKKRKQTRVPLAWEDPHLRSQDAEKDQDDDDVPLGMLYPSKDGIINKRFGDSRDWDRPLGLMEKRELEDSEPLSSRRNRLRGGSPTRAQSPSRRPATGLGLVPYASNMQGEEQAGEENPQDADEDNGGESLTQRMRRMKTKDALDTAIADVTTKDGAERDSTFTDELLSQFGGLNVKDQAKATAAATPGKPDIEETLGQRRARLQREREAGGAATGEQRPPLKSAASLANLLSSNPVGQRAASKNYQPAQGTLLHTSSQQQALHKSQILGQNMRSSSLGLDHPLVDPRATTTRDPSSSFGGLLSQQHNRAPNGGFANGAYNNGAGGVTVHNATTSPMVGVGGANGQFAATFASPTTMPFQQQQQGFAYNPFAYHGLTAASTPMQQYGFPQQQQQPMMMMAGQGYSQPYGYSMYGGMPQMPTMANMHASMAMPSQMQMGMPTPPPGASPMGMSGMMESPMQPHQRAAIDRWRMDIA